MRRDSGAFWWGLLRLSGIIAFIMVIAAVILPIVARSRRSGPSTNCPNNLKQLGTAMNMYQADWDDRFPVLSTTANRAEGEHGWSDLLMVYTKNRMVFHCPRDPSTMEPPDKYRLVTLSYSFNRRLSGMKDSAIREPAEVAAIWDTVSTAEYCNNTNGDTIWHWGDKDWPKPGDYVAWPEHAERMCRNWPPLAQPRHPGAVNNVCYADGHAKPCKPGEVPRLSPK